MRYAGRTFLLKIQEANGSYTTLAGQRDTSFVRQSAPIDGTDKDGSRWRKLVAGASGITDDVSSVGLIENAAAHKRLLQLVATGEIAQFRLIFADGVEYEGPYQVASVEGSGDYQAAQQYSLELRSAAEVEEVEGAALLLVEGGAALLLVEGGAELLLVEEA